MKYVTALTLGLLLSACAHETTTMDRELALKLVDRPQVVVAAPSAPPVFNVSFNNQGGSSVGTKPKFDPTQPYEIGQPAIAQSPCRQSPVFDVNGNFERMEKHCFGSQE